MAPLNRKTIRISDMDPMGRMEAAVDLGLVTRVEALRELVAEIGQLMSDLELWASRDHPDGYGMALQRASAHLEQAADAGHQDAAVEGLRAFAEEVTTARLNGAALCDALAVRAAALLKATASYRPDCAPSALVTNGGVVWGLLPVDLKDDDQVNALVDQEGPACERIVAAPVRRPI